MTYWECLICTERQETMPYIQICDKCIDPFAAYLCRQEMHPVKRSDGLDIWDHPAINQDHFRMLARQQASALLRRWKPRGSKVVVTDDMVDRMLLIHDEIDYAADPTANWVIGARAKMRKSLEALFK